MSLPRHTPAAASLLLSWVWMGCGAPQNEPSSDADFFAQHASLECELLAECDAESFAQRFDDDDDCLDRLNPGDACEVVDDAQAELCLAVMASLTCADLEESGRLPSLPNCTTAITCSGLD